MNQRNGKLIKDRFIVNRRHDSRIILFFLGNKFQFYVGIVYHFSFTELQKIHQRQHIIDLHIQKKLLISVSKCIARIPLYVFILCVMCPTVFFVSHSIPSNLNQAFIAVNMTERNMIFLDVLYFANGKWIILTLFLYCNLFSLSCSVLNGIFAPI